MPAAGHGMQWEESHNHVIDIAYTRAIIIVARTIVNTELLCPFLKVLDRTLGQIYRMKVTK